MKLTEHIDKKCPYCEGNGRLVYTDLKLWVKYASILFGMSISATVIYITLTQ